MINFKEHDGLLFNMLEEHEIMPLKENDANVLVRFITHGVIGEYVMEHWLDCNQKNVPIYVEGVDSDGDVTVWIDDVHHCCPFPMFEIIGTFVKEGSADWALYQMMKGNKVRNRDWDGGLHEKSLLYCQLIGETIKYNEGCSAFDVCLSDWEAPYIKNTGWQLYVEPEPQHAKEPIADCENCKHVCTNSNIDHCHMYEPKPKPQYKVGDWVEHKESKEQATIRRIMSYGAIEIEFAYSTESDIYQANDFHNDFRKLSPSEVIVKIGCLSGTIAKSCDPNYFLMWHSSPSPDRDYSIIKFTAIDKETREFVESLLKAQEEE